MKNKGIKLLIFNIALVLINVVLFSRAFLGIDITGGSAAEAALGVTVILMSIVSFFYFNYRLLFDFDNSQTDPRERTVPETLEDFQYELKKYVDTHYKTFADSLITVINQINRFNKRKLTVKAVLLEKFQESEMSYAKFSGVVDGVENILLINVKNLLNRVNTFDESEYETALKIGNSNPRLLKIKQGIFNEYSSYVRRVVDNNEEMLIKLDKLILEITKLSEVHDGELEELDAMREIDALIADAKWYK